MKKKILLMIMLVVTFLIGTSNVDATTLTKDEIKNNSYIIGKYYFTRDTNSKYNGTLTTQEIMLAANTISNSNSLDNMIIYYKNFLGNWINGLTGESINPPSEFEIENRNLIDMPLASSHLKCKFNTTSTKVTALCAFPDLFELKKDSAVEKLDFEYYVVKTSEDELPTTPYPNKTHYAKVDYVVETTQLGDIVGNKIEIDISEGQYVMLSSRTYYEDGEEKIYSDYSPNIFNIPVGVTNNSVTLVATKNADDEIKIQDDYDLFGVGVNGEVNFYDTRFSLTTTLDTNKYYIRAFNVYSTTEATIDFIDFFKAGDNDPLRTLRTLYYYDIIRSDGPYQKMYLLPEHATYDDKRLVARASGVNGYGEDTDILSISVPSKKIYQYSSGSSAAYPEVTVCDKNVSGYCFTLWPDEIDVND